MKVKEQISKNNPSVYADWRLGNFSNVTDQMVDEYLEHHRNPNDHSGNFIIED